MKNEIKIIFLLILGFIALLQLEEPLRLFMINIDLPEFSIKLISEMATRVIIIIGSMIVIYKLNLSKFNGFRKEIKLSNIQALTIPLLFVLMATIGNWQVYVDTNRTLLFLFLSSMIVVGLTEELIFRGIILALLIKVFKNNKATLYYSVLISSFIFAFGHYINLFEEHDNFWGISRQVFFAFSLGIFFSGLFLRTQNIIIPAIVHGLINFSFGSGELMRDENHITNQNIVVKTSLISTLPIILLFIFIMLGGLYMIKQINSKDVLNKFKKTSTN